MLAGIDDEYFNGVSRLDVKLPVPIDLLLSLAMADRTHGVASGVGIALDGTYYTTDGQVFLPSSAGPLNSAYTRSFSFHERQGSDVF